jgi:hypothetical protein
MMHHLILDGVIPETKHPLIVTNHIFLVCIVMLGDARIVFVNAIFGNPSGGSGLNSNHSSDVLNFRFHPIYMTGNWT